MQQQPEDASTTLCKLNSNYFSFPLLCGGDSQNIAHEIWKRKRRRKLTFGKRKKKILRLACVGAWKKKFFFVMWCKLPPKKNGGRREGFHYLSAIDFFSLHCGKVATKEKGGNNFPRTAQVRKIKIKQAKFWRAEVQLSFFFLFNQIACRGELISKLSLRQQQKKKTALARQAKVLNALC